MWLIDDLVDLGDDSRSGRSRARPAGAGRRRPRATARLTAVADAPPRPAEKLESGLLGRAALDPFLCFVQRYAGL
jgi:hypothetical protein